jgi:hypothetical protein
MQAHLKNERHKENIRWWLRSFKKMFSFGLKNHRQPSVAPGAPKQTQALNAHFGFVCRLSSGAIALVNRDGDSPAATWLRRLSAVMPVFKWYPASSR